MEEKVVRISVRNLVEFILREGDIDNRISGSMDSTLMQLGSKIHRKIQKRMGSAYRAEVPLKLQIPVEGFVLQIEGRADGILEEEDHVMIDEIKGVMKELTSITEPIGVHLAQARCYAYIYALQNQWEEIGVQLTYCNMETEEIKRFQETLNFQELEHWFLDVVHQYEKWARFRIQWREKRNRSIKALEFPFPYREGQKDLAVSVYRTILRKKKLFVQAPTGVGKTMATIFPTVKAVGEGLGEKIFYLTAKTITRTVAERAFQTLKEQEFQMKVITLTAKEKICFCEETECNPDACPYAKGHFDRVNDAMYDLLTTADDMDRSTLEEQAKKHRVCPFELSLDLSEWADAVICDYNYVFDPNAHLKRFFGEGTKEEYLFLVDEAHNLVERGREMYSAVLYKEEILEVQKLVRLEAAKLAKALRECNKQFLELKRECENYRVQTSVSHIALKLMNVLTELEDYLEKRRGEEIHSEILDFFFKVRNFLSIYERLDDHYVIYTELEENGRFKLKLACMNPAENLQEYLNMGNSTIFFSATFLPIHYYKKLLSTGTDDYAIYIRSSFPVQNRRILLGMDVTTKYTMRGMDMYEKYASYLLKITAEKRGNYLVFFPSYRFMESVLEKVKDRMEREAFSVKCLVQEPYMDEAQREAFLYAFGKTQKKAEKGMTEETKAETLLGFCVLGGVFSEGIDLTGDSLIGAIIVGTGLPQVCNDREILKAYFDSQNLPGFDYAYRYPGMNKVLQAAGRVIRTEEDRGIIVLLDERFQGTKNRAIFPKEWSDCTTGNEETILKEVKDFWQSP